LEIVDDIENVEVEGIEVDVEEIEGIATSTT